MKYELQITRSTPNMDAYREAFTEPVEADRVMELVDYFFNHFQFDEGFPDAITLVQVEEAENG